MRIKTMLYSLAAVALTSAATTTTACAQQANLPAPVKSFIEKNFPAPKYREVEVDRAHSGRIMYDIELKGGTEIKIDDQGNWHKIDCGRDAIPVQVVPAKIREYVTANYTDKVISEIETDRGGYSVELSPSNKLDVVTKEIKLLFDSAGNFQAAGHD